MTVWRFLSFRQAFSRVRFVLARLILTVVCVALGVTLVVAFQVMNASVLSSFLETADAMAGRAALTVEAGDGVAFSESVVEAVSGVEGVTLAVPLVRSVAFPDDGSGEMLTVHGVDLTHDAAVRVYHTQDGDLAMGDMVEFLNQADSILLAREFAESRHLQVGSQIRLVTPRGTQDFTVRGVLEAQGLARTLGGRLVVMDLFAAERAFTADGQINQIDVLVDDNADLDHVRATITALLPDGLSVEEPSIRRDFVRKSVSGFQAMVTAFSVLAVIAGLVVSYGRLAAVFEARTWEMGVLRAVGLKQRIVLLELIKEALILGVLGTGIGVVLGSWFGREALPFLARATAIALRQPVPSASPSILPSAVLLGCAVGIGSALVAAAVPALRLSNTPPVLALGMRGREMPLPQGLQKWRLRLVVLFLLVATLAYQILTASVAAGIVTTVLIGVVACLIAMPLVQLGESLFSKPWHMMFGPAGRYAASQLGRHTRRASLIVATLGLGLGVVLLFGMLGWSFELTLHGILNRSLRADLIVSSAFVSGGYWSAPVDDSVVSELASIPGVAVSAGEQSKEVPYEGGSVHIKSFDSVAFKDSRIYEWPLSAGGSDSLASVAEGDAALVTRAFAHANGTRVGDRVHLETPTGSLELRVVAVTDAPVENAIILSRELYRARWGDPMVSLVHVAQTESADLASLREAILARIGERYRVLVRSRDEVVDYFVGQVREAFSVLYLMEAATFLLVLLGIGDALVASVVERTREIGMMRAVGLNRFHLFRMVMLEGLAIGVLGLFLALVAGAALGAFWVRVQFPLILGWRIDLHFPTLFAFGAALLTLLLCVVGSFLPSLRAARLSIPDALREE